jgi:hypothetical protein
MNGYAPLGGRLKAVIIVFALVTLVWTLSAVFGVLEVAMLSRLIDGQAVTEAELVASDDRIALIASLIWPARIVGAIAFITWLYRAYGNVDAVEPGGRRFDRGWAIGAWFVPFLALWRPKQIVNDIWRAGDTHQGFLIGTIWWTLWLLMTPYYWVANGMYTDAQTPEEIRTASATLLVGDLIGVTTAVLAVMIAIRATRRLDRRAAARSRPPEPEWRILPPVEREADKPFPAYPG